MTIKEVKKGESVKLEFKREVPERSENYLKTVSAFSNSSGGQIVFGIDDRTLEPIGIQGDIYKIQDSIINTISDNIEPLISPNISVQSIEDKAVIVLEIFPTNHTPCFIKAKGKEAGTYIRIGATSRIADSYSLKELELNGIRSSFDSQRCVSLMSNESYFNEEVIQKLCNQINERLKKASVQDTVNKKTLESLGVLKNINGEIVPTNAFALLTLSDFYEFSRCSIRCACFKGTEKNIFLDKLDCVGPIFNQVDDALKFIIKNIKVGIRFEGIQGVDNFEIPKNALREALVNAVVHRNYMIEEPTRVAIFDDRVEIISPGRLICGQSVENAMNGKSLSRNPVISKIFRRMLLMEEWGSGFKRIMQECEKAHIAFPIFQENDMDCTLIFKRSSFKDNAKNKTPLKVTKKGKSSNTKVEPLSDIPKVAQKTYDFIATNPNATIKEIQKSLKISERTVMNHISLLKDSFIKRIGSDKTGYWEIIKKD